MQDTNMPPEVRPITDRDAGDNVRHRNRCDRDRVSNAAAYRASFNAALAGAEARVKCRKRINLAIERSTADAAFLSVEMIRVGTWAACELGNRTTTALLLDKLSRRIRSGDSLDF